MLKVGNLQKKTKIKQTIPLGGICPVCGEDDFPEGILGGLWHTDAPEEQERVLACQLYKLVYVLAKRDIPMTLLLFPKIIYDSEYLYKKIVYALDGISFKNFRAVFEQTARPQLVHDFSKELLDCRSTRG